MIKITLPDDLNDDYCLNVINLIRVADDTAAISMMKLALQTAYSAGWGEATERDSSELDAMVEAAIRHDEGVKDN
jgi:hypothetical protein